MDEVKPKEVEKLDEIVEDEDLQISPEEMLVVDFINELQLKYETEAQEQIAKQVKEKFGDLGAKVIEQLNTNINSNENAIEECSECGKVSEEWLKKSQEKLKIVEIFLDDDTEELAKKIIDDCDGEIIRKSVIIENICEYDGCTAAEVTDERIDAIQKKILFMGIVDGWLPDEYFIRE